MFCLFLEFPSSAARRGDHALAIDYPKDSGTRGFCRGYASQSTKWDVEGRFDLAWGFAFNISSCSICQLARPIPLHKLSPLGKKRGLRRIVFGRLNRAKPGRRSQKNTSSICFPIRRVPASMSGIWRDIPRQILSPVTGECGATMFASHGMGRLRASCGTACRADRYPPSPHDQKEHR